MQNIQRPTQPGFCRKSDPKKCNPGETLADDRILPYPQKRKAPGFQGLKVERVIGVEPTTLCLASIRSSQLSYTRIE